MIFINLCKFREKPAIVSSKSSEIKKGMEKEGIKFLASYWTLGRYDTVVIMEAPDEKTIMKANRLLSDIAAVETMVGLTAEEAHKLLQ